MNGAVGDGSQAFVVSHNDKRLPQTVAQVEEKLVQFSLVVGVEAARWLIGQHNGRPVDQARATATRCFSPPESSFGLCEARSARPIIVSISRAEAWAS